MIWQNELKYAFTDLDLEEDEPLPLKFKFLDMKNSDGTENSLFHIKQYVTFMKPIELTKKQIVIQF